MPEAPNAVRELAEDATSRKQFLRKAGGTGVAASLAAFIAACGGDSSRASSSIARRDRHGDGEQERHRAVRQGRSRHRQLRADARVPRGRLLREGRQQRHAQGQGARPRPQVRQRGAGARRRAHRADQEGGRQAGRQAEGEVPARQREVDPRSSPRPSRTSAPTPTSARPGNIQDKEILAAALSIHSVEARHASVLNLATNAKPAHGPVRQAGDRRRGAQDRQAVPGHLAPKGPNPNGEHRDPGHEPRGLPGPRRARHRRRLRRRVRHPVGDRRARAGRGRGRRHPQLRPHPRVPRGGLLQAGGQARAQGRVQVARQGLRRQRAGARRRADRDDQEARRQARQVARRSRSASRRRRTSRSSRSRSRTPACRPTTARRR